MSGILDNKSRIIDVIITSEGRRQIASGDLRVRYASFSDSATFYEADAVSGSSDASSRIYLEASSLPQDQIVFEADDSGKLMPFGINSDHTQQAGQLLSYSFTAATSSVITGSNESLTVVTGDAFASTMQGIFTGSIDNFGKLQLIGSYDALLEDDGFAAGPTTITYTITDDRPLAAHIPNTCNINHLESLFNDPRLANVQNFQFLPPINKQLPSVDKKHQSRDRIGDYAPWGGVDQGKNPKEAYNTLRNELQHFERLGFMKTILFDPTSRENALIGQMFEVSDRLTTKLDVIHHGKFSTHDSTTPVADVFFVGKVIVDDNETQSFVHLFTLIFE
jgi:hypothetical protein